MYTKSSKWTNRGWKWCSGPNVCLCQKLLMEWYPPPTPPMFVEFCSKKGSHEFGEYPPITDHIRRVVFDLLPSRYNCKIFVKKKAAWFYSSRVKRQPLSKKTAWLSPACGLCIFICHSPSDGDAQMFCAIIFCILTVLCFLFCI